MTSIRSFGNKNNLRALGLALCAVTAVALTVGCKKDGAASGDAGAAASATPGAAACPAGQLTMVGPGICLAVPSGYVAPVSMSNSTAPGGGSLNVSYSADGTSGGKFVATVNVTYNAASPAPPNFKYLDDDAKQYCDTPPKMEDIAGGKGKFFQCMSKKLEGHSYAKSKIYTAKNVIDCSSQSEKKPEVDTACKTLKQM